MALPELNVELRSQEGKGAARKIRAAGFVPAVFYGPGMEPASIRLDPLVLRKLMIQAPSRSFLLTLNLGGRAETVMLKEVQIHPVSRRFLHADFVRVETDRELTMPVSVELVGQPAGGAKGGILEVKAQSVRLSGLPMALPEKISVDLSALNIGEALRAADLKLPEGIRCLEDPGLVLAVVSAPVLASAEEEKPAEAEAEAPAEATKPTKGKKGA